MQGVVTFTDEFTINRSAEAADELMAALESSDEVTVDISGVERVDVAALQVLVAAKKECEKAGRKMVFKISDAGKDLLSLTGIQL